MANDFVTNLQNGLKTLAQQEFEQYSVTAVNLAIESGQKFLTRYDADLSDWQNQVASGDMDEDDLRWLLQSREDLIELETLKKEGLAKVALDRFINGLIEVIVSAAKAASP